MYTGPWLARRAAGLAPVRQEWRDRREEMPQSAIRRYRCAGRGQTLGPAQSGWSPRVISSFVAAGPNHHQRIMMRDESGGSAKLRCNSAIDCVVWVQAYAEVSNPARSKRAVAR